MKKKKICMVGDFAVGKTSLTQKFVNNVFSDKYLTTVGVKIDTVERADTKLVIWDIAGRDSLSPINANYLVGASGVIIVADGTRLSTVQAIEQLKSTVRQRVGEVAMICAINKVDDQDNWLVDDVMINNICELGCDVLLTSAKSGANVSEIFDTLANKIS